LTVVHSNAENQHLHFYDLATMHLCLIWNKTPREGNLTCWKWIASVV